MCVDVPGPTIHPSYTNVHTRTLPAFIVTVTSWVENNNMESLDDWHVPHAIVSLHNSLQCQDDPSCLVYGVAEASGI